MARVLRTFDWSRVSRYNEAPRRRTYPWDDWFDGRIWQLVEGEDFDGPSTSMEKVVRSTAYAKGLKVRARVNDEGVVVQRHEDARRVSGKTRSPSKAALHAALAE